MISHWRKGAGFTLVELMITLVVLVILITLATPSFTEMAQRSALRAAADGIVFLVGNARQEAVKRDVVVRVDYEVPASGGFCVGASTEAAGCDCAVAPTQCDAGVYPETSGDTKWVTITGTPKLSFQIDPKTGMLTDLDNTSSLDLTVPTKYEVRIQVNAMARPGTCNPGDKGLPGVSPC